MNYRYPDRTVQYAPVFPFDLDGDGLENSVDPEPLVAGPDAHGTNAEWYNRVCGNVFSATEGTDGIVLAPRTSDVNTNAYYFVDVVAADGPAPIYFNGSQPGRLGSPVVMARAGETNRVPLLIGVEYAVTSPAPFAVSVPTNGFAEVRANNGYSSDYTVKWPLEFTFTEGFSESSRIYTVDVGPCDPGGDVHLGRCVASECAAAEWWWSGGVQLRFRYGKYAHFWVFLDLYMWWPLPCARVVSF